VAAGGGRFPTGSMVTFSVSIRELDADTVMVRVSGESAADGACADLGEALDRAQRCGKHGLVIDLTELRDPGADLLAITSACHVRCVNEGRWLLVVPPLVPLADFFKSLPGRAG
jgi:hypothetical protein